MGQNNSQNCNVNKIGRRSNGCAGGVVGYSIKWKSATSQCVGRGWGWGSQSPARGTWVHRREWLWCHTEGRGREVHVRHKVPVSSHRHNEATERWQEQMVEVQNEGAGRVEARLVNGLTRRHAEATIPHHRGLSSPVPPSLSKTPHGGMVTQHVYSMSHTQNKAHNTNPPTTGPTHKPAW